MCGIAGFIGDYPKPLLHAMNQSLAHRGPDDYGELFDAENRLGLSHRRLSIIDLSPRGRQPMWDETGQVAIVFNGEIFNYRECRKRLEGSGHAFKSDSDTEVILNLYLRYGEGIFSRLNGMYAFAIWDSRDKSLLVARDGVGVKPLYYCESDRGFLFASELKALLQSPHVDRELDHQAIHSYLTYLWCPAPSTMLKSIKKLEPGFALRIKFGRIVKRWCFYDLPYDQAIVPMTEQEAIESVRESVETAVERQMVSDVPIGALLSGGLDSSAVVALARKAAPDQDFKCFTIGFNDKSFADEGWAEDLPYARQVAQHLGVDLETVYVGPEMASEVESMVYHLDEPQADFAPINTYFICKLARDHGIKVLLSGAGGDDIFSGYRRHYALGIEQGWSWLPQLFRRAIRSTARKIPSNSAQLRRIAKAFSYADLDGDSRLSSYFQWIDPEFLHKIYSNDMLSALHASDYADPLIHSLDRLPPNMPDLNRMLYLDGKHFLADHNLNYFDKMSMATGIEVRVPLLDPDLISLAARLPTQYKQRGGVSKWVLKKAMEPYLPEQVIYRTKSGFGVPLRTWLGSELKPLVNDTLSEHSLSKRGLFNVEAVRDLQKRTQSGAIDATYTILSMMCIELWCRMFLDVQNPSPPAPLAI
ncbi:MAG: asparagine synthase (glutamine-hydrolyzing) [Deltaproteobacteria bacterium]|nr:asparagine synthase (glutamine-hydrolyzing) [Deltaproteobacteria bacterium]